MADVLIPRPAQTLMGAAVQALLPTGKVRLFTADLASFSQNTTRAELIAAEATFSGYTAGGYSVAAFTGPVLDPVSGVYLLSPLILPTVAVASPQVENLIRGYWYEVGTDVWQVGKFPSDQPMVSPGNNIPFMFRFKLFSNPQS